MTSQQLATRVLIDLAYERIVTPAQAPKAFAKLVALATEEPLITTVSQLRAAVDARITSGTAAKTEARKAKRLAAKHAPPAI